MSTSTIDPASLPTIPTIQYETPSTGNTVTVISNSNVRLIIDPAGALLALTIALPGSPSNNDVVTFGSSQAVTTLTISGGTIVGALTSLAIGSCATYVYYSVASKWFRLG